MKKRNILPKYEDWRPFSFSAQKLNQTSRSIFKLRKYVVYLQLATVDKIQVKYFLECKDRTKKEGSKSNKKEKKAHNRAHMVTSSVLSLY